ncbi:MAG: hypothetical protein HYX41_04690 [Bdellovibrio sp.]|nr:hypothetical protein [Bdellovibrio sp.]
MKKCWIESTGARLVLGFLVFQAGSASFAWDVHQTLMPSILEYIDASSPGALKDTLGRVFPTPCETDDQTLLKQIVPDFQLNPAATLPAFKVAQISQQCGVQAPITIREILLGPSVDDPDKGIDRDLPDSFDPTNERDWMGGRTGSSSQGFRHMYFGGWTIKSPLTTFQIPFHEIGQAAERAELFGTKSKKFLNAGVGAWSIRILGWALHYIQDLSQPFHTSQIISFRIIPLYELLAWPPSQAWANLKKESSRTIANYHWSLEGYVRTRLKEGVASPFAECLRNPKAYSTLDVEALSSPREIAKEVAKQSIGIASRLAKAETDFFSMKLMQPDFDLSAFKGEIDYSDYGSRPQLTAEREALHSVVCQALANASIASERLIRVALSP